MADTPKTKKKSLPPVLTTDELRACAEKQLEGAALALDFRDQAYYYKKAAEFLSSIPDDPASAAQATAYRQKADEISNNGYQTAYDQASTRMTHADNAEDFYQAASAFRKIAGYQDADTLAEECEQRYTKRTHKKHSKLVIVILILTLLATAVIGVQTPFGKYQLGQLYLTTSHYSGALSIFIHLGDYQDSETQAKESRYQLAQEHMEHQRYEKAIKHFQKLGAYKDSQMQQTFAEQLLLTTADRGDTVSFGSEKWIILRANEGLVLLLQKEPTEETAAFNQTRTSTNWNSCTLRDWLNTDYLSETFSPPEQEILTLAKPDRSTDSVFLLSAEEVSYSRGLLSETDYNWWLRTSGASPDTASFVSPSNQVMDYGYPVDNTDIRVRPAIWVDCTTR